MCLNETMECVWIQCVIPMLVSDEVRRVGDSITEIVSDLCSTSPKESRLFLNAPDYLFVSTNLAKKFPKLMESIVVQSYFSHIPGELSKLWNVGSVARIRRYHNLRNITLLTTILSLVQYFGTAPFFLHRVFIRFMQPFVFGGIVLLWSIIISNPMYIAIMTLALGLVVAYCAFKFFYGSSSSNVLSLITPVVHTGDKQVDGNILETKTDGGVHDNQMVVHLDMNEFLEARDDKDSSADNSSSHFRAGSELASEVQSGTSNSSHTAIEFSIIGDRSIIRAAYEADDSKKSNSSSDDDLSSIDSSILIKSTTDSEKEE